MSTPTTPATPSQPPGLRRRLGAALNRTPGLKQLVKRTFYALRDPIGRGCLLPVGDCPVRVPGRFVEPPWTDYELPSTRAVAAWLETRPEAGVLDIGCSVGLYSLLTLARSPRGVAYAFDADLVSLQATRWLCQHVGTDRLNVVHGFVSDEPLSGLDAAAATQATLHRLVRERIPAEPSAGGYVCIDGQEHAGIPTHSIDGLFAGAGAGRPWLLKCDVEGAEMLVLRGASAFVRRARPQLLISVHPATLAGFGFSRDDIGRWFADHGYTWRILSIDHEEHWWSEPVT